MMKKIVLIALAIAAFSCEPRQGKSVEDVPTSKKSNLHEIVVQEVVAAQNYTYVRALEQDKEIWMAILKTDIEVGKTYYYDRAMEMKNFKSKDLDREFASVYFLEGLFENPDDFTKMGMKAPTDKVHSTADANVRQEIIIEFEDGVTVIEDLYAKKNELENNKVMVQGIVTKYNANIMNKNWVHIQDGTGTQTTYDLTITTQDEVRVGSMVKFEGTVGVDVDFGHGYKYDLILQEANLLNKKPDTKIN